MPTLKSRTAHPPGGFQVVIPELGQRKATVGSFEFCKAYVMSAVRGNRFLADKHGWRSDAEWAANYVEAQNVARLAANPKFHHFLTMEAELAPPAPRDIPDGDEDGSKKNLVASVVGGSRRLAAGVRVLLDWLGSGGKPVEATKAEARAVICADCPKNSGGDWKAFFTKPIAEKIRQQMAMKHEMHLVTPSDDKLTVCVACDCPLALKVHVPLEHILKHTDADTRQRLDARCWILKENPKETP